MTTIRVQIADFDIGAEPEGGPVGAELFAEFGGAEMFQLLRGGEADAIGGAGDEQIGNGFRFVIDSSADLTDELANARLSVVGMSLHDLRHS